jgi:hypothetical protein
MYILKVLNNFSTWQIRGYVYYFTGLRSWLKVLDLQVLGRVQILVLPKQKVKSKSLGIC